MRKYNIRDLLQLEKSYLVVAQIGWIREVKRTEDFINLAKRFKGRPNVLFTIIGEYGSDQAYNLRIRQLVDQCPNVHLMGLVENLNEYYASLDLVVSTCAIESFGRSMAEALASGVPAIGVQGCAAEEIIRHGESGYLIREGDLEALAHYTGRIIDSRDHRMQLGEFGKRDIENRFGVNKIRMQYLNLYRVLCHAE